MKRLFLSLLAAAALSGCDDPSATAQMPEFYVYKSQPYCLAELRSNEPNAEVRKGDTFQLLTTLYRNSQAWSDRYNIVGVDYVGFSQMTLVIKGDCSDSDAVNRAIADVAEASAKYMVKMGGNAALVGDADSLADGASPSSRFLKLNPGAKIENCLLHFTLPRTMEDVDQKIPRAVGVTADQFHFPIADLTYEGNDLFMLLARDCGERDVIAKNIAEALGMHGMTEQEIVRAKDTAVGDYLKIRPET